MATKDSDELFDYLCFPCSKKDANSEAVKYCMDCREYLCGVCVESHNSFTVLDGHTLVGKSHAQYGNTSKPSTDNKRSLPSVPTERCELHSLKLVDMYCADHDSVGCHACFTINHKSCQGIHYIPEYVQTIPQAEQIRKIKEEMEKAIPELDDVMKQKQKDIEDNRKTKAIHIEEIKAFREEINQTLDRLEQDSIAELNEKYDKLDKGFQEELDELQNTVDRLTTRNAKIESSRRNASQQFVNTKICEKIIFEITEKLKVPGNTEICGITFEKHPQILHVLQQINSLGKFIYQTRQFLYKIQSTENYNVKLNDDKLDCDIWSACVLDSGDILLADYDNKNIKKVDLKRYPGIDSLVMPSKPRSVCEVNSTEAAVSVENRTVHFVSTKSRLVLTRSLKFGHGCRGIAIIDDQLVICESGRKVYVYKMNGDRLKAIDKDRSGNDIFGHIREISARNGVIHMADNVKGPVGIDTDGNVIWRYSDQDLKGAFGVCTDRGANVFMSGMSSKNVVQLTSEGKLLGEVVSNTHGLKCPQALSFDAKKCKLIVSDGNELHVFHVK